MSQTYTVLSPWAKSDYLVKYPINPRPSELAGKTIGLYASFKEYHPFFMQELERQLSAVLPAWPMIVSSPVVLLNASSAIASAFVGI